MESYGYSERTIVDAYEGFREATRKRSSLLFGTELRVDISTSLHPFRQLRREINPSEVAKRLCIPQATIQHFERKWKTQQSVPKEIVVALVEIGYGSQVYGFSEAYKLWRRMMLDKQYGVVVNG